MLKLRNAEAFERFDYPGPLYRQVAGTKLTRTLMEAEEAALPRRAGRQQLSRVSTRAASSRLPSHPCEKDSTAYVIRRVRHEATDNSHLDQGSEPSRYDNTFEAIPYDVPFRPLRVTEKPFVHGPQTAIVVGPPGEKIFTDKHGRVRVQFHWDRYGKHDDKSSCWIRVSHAWAGRGWGAVNLPHVGHEVVVSFLEGDPDRPLVTGRVYNGENTTAMGMPDNKTQSGHARPQRQRDRDGGQVGIRGHPGQRDQGHERHRDARLQRDGEDRQPHDRDPKRHAHRDDQGKYQHHRDYRIVHAHCCRQHRRSHQQAGKFPRFDRCTCVYTGCDKYSATRWPKHDLDGQRRPDKDPGS